MKIAHLRLMQFPNRYHLLIWALVLSPTLALSSELLEDFPAEAVSAAEPEEAEEVEAAEAEQAEVPWEVGSGTPAGALEEAATTMEEAVGGNSSGGGGFAQVQGSDQLILLDYLNLYERYRKMPKPSMESGQIEPQGMAFWTGFGKVEMKTQPAYKLVQERLSLWQEVAPLTVEAVRVALNSMSWQYSPYSLKKHPSLEISAGAHLEGENLTIVPAVLYTRHYGAWISLPLWNNRIDLLNQAGLLLHEGLRQIQHNIAENMSDQDVQILTAHLMLSLPGETEFDPDRSYFGFLRAGQSQASEVPRGQISRKKLCSRLTAWSPLPQSRATGKLHSPEGFKAGVCYKMRAHSYDPFQIYGFACQENSFVFDSRSLGLLLLLKGFAVAFEEDLQGSADSGLSTEKLQEIEQLIAVYRSLESLLSQSQMEHLARQQVGEGIKDFCAESSESPSSLQLSGAFEFYNNTVGKRDSSFNELLDLVQLQGQAHRQELLKKLQIGSLAYQELARSFGEATDALHLISLHRAFENAGVSPLLIRSLILTLADAAEAKDVSRELRRIFKDLTEEQLDQVLPAFEKATEHVIRLRSYYRFLDIPGT